MPLTRVRSWFAEGRHGWLTIAVLAVAALVVVLHPTERVARGTAAGLELLGLAVVALGLRDTRRTFGLKPFRRVFADYLSALFGRRNINIVAGTGEIRLGGMRVDATATTRLPPDATVEQRLGALETKLDNLATAVQLTRRNLELEADKRTAAIAAEAQARAAELEKVRTLIKEAVAGGLALEAAGVVWLFAGIVLSAFAPEMR